MGFDIARGGLLDFNVTAAGMDLDVAAHADGVNLAAAGHGFHGAFGGIDFDRARSGGGVHIGARIVDVEGART